MLSRLVSRDGVKASVKDAHEEILPEAPEAEKLEDDQDVFEENDLDSIKNLDTRWKFIGDCAFLIPENEDVENTKFNNVEAPAQIDQRKRYRLISDTKNILKINFKNCKKNTKLQRFKQVLR